MSEAERVRAAWERIERWLGRHLPAALENLRPPAREQDVAELEQQLGQELPEALRASLALHDGETNNWPPHCMSDGQWLLSTSEIAAHWKLLRELGLQLDGATENPDQWKAQIEDGIIFVDGPVKPLAGSAHWIPISEMNGDVLRYLDLDPAPGGTAGQVIEVDPEGCSHRVLAGSLVEHLTRYAEDLEANRYEVDEGVLCARDAPDTAPSDVPDYLRNVTYEQYSENEARAAEAEATPPTALQPGDETTLVGEMGMLVGGASLLFALHTHAGRRYWIRACPDVTRGYGAIAVEQGARIRVRREPSGLLSTLAQRLHLRPIPLLALEYKMLRIQES